jgi:hypothetical protein
MKKQYTYFYIIETVFKPDELYKRLEQTYLE